MTERLARRQFVWLGAFLVVLVVAGLAAWWFLAGAARPGGEPGSVVLEMSGTGDERSAEFYTRPGWSIEWDTTGNSFSYAIGGDAFLGQMIDQDGPGGGITSPVPTGNFFIQVDAEGPWSIRVIQGE